MTTQRCSSLIVTNHSMRKIICLNTHFFYISNYFLGTCEAEITTFIEIRTFRLKAKLRLLIKKNIKNASATSSLVFIFWNFFSRLPCLSVVLLHSDKFVTFPPCTTMIFTFTFAFSSFLKDNMLVFNLKKTIKK